MSLGVEKVIPVQLDLGNLACFDVNFLEDSSIKQGKEEREEYLKSLARDNLQLLVNNLFKLNTEPSDIGPLASLPKPIASIPRSKSIPKPKEPTKWEQFAKAKGILKRKRGSHAFDDQKQEWRPRYGRKSVKNDKLANWITELKPGQQIPDDE